MITCKPSDYLTISLMSDKENSIALADFISLFLDTMYLTDMLPLMQFKCSTLRYEQIFRFEDIQIKIPYEENYKKQGICLEFSGHGIDYYIEWLKTKYNTCLRSVMKRFYALALQGFKPNCSRFDVAFDEKIENSGENKYLDMNSIKTALLERRFVSCFRKSDPERCSSDLSSAVNDFTNSDDSLHADFISSMNLCSGAVGQTIQLGKRNSTSLIRFYDKKVEQEVKGIVVPKNISSWVRCEIEFKKRNANSILMKFVELSDKDFVAYCSGVLLGLIRFVNLDRSRRYNCSVCEWWLGFLKHVKAAKLVHFKPKRNKYLRAVAYLRQQVAPSLNVLFKCSPMELYSILQFGSDKVDTSKSAMAIRSDFEALQKLSPDEYAEECHRSLSELSGVEFLRLFSAKSDKEFCAFLTELESA